MYLVLLGAPGAGKGTQVTNIAERFDLAQISTGELFRAAAAKQTDLGIKAQSYMKQGKLVPDDITIGMVLEQMSQIKKSGVIFDGFPRSLKQAEALDEALQTQGKQIDRVIYMKVSEEELLKRLGNRWICRSCQTPYHAIVSPPNVKGKCDRCGGELYQRPDDAPETVMARLKVYFTETAPLIDYYQKTGKLIEVNGEGDMDEVSRRIVEVLKK